MTRPGEKRKADFKIVILGDSSVGKTTLIHRYMDGIFAENATTIGASFFLKQWGTHNVAIWDTAGEEKYASLSSFYCRGASAAILAYDLTRQSSFSVLQQRHIPLLASAHDDCLCVVVGTKHDLVNEESRQVSEIVGMALARAQNLTKIDSLSQIPYFETSSKTGKNVDNVFSFILNSCLPLDKKEKDSTKKNSVVNLDSPQTTTCKNSSKCCK